MVDISIWPLVVLSRCSGHRSSVVTRVASLCGVSAGVVRIRSELRRQDHWSHETVPPPLDYLYNITEASAVGPAPVTSVLRCVTPGHTMWPSPRSYHAPPHLAKCHLSGHLGSHQPLPWVSSVPRPRMHSIRDYLPPGILKLNSMRSWKSR